MDRRAGRRRGRGPRQLACGPTPPTSREDRHVPYTSFVDALLLLVRDEHGLLTERSNTGYADG